MGDRSATRIVMVFLLVAGCSQRSPIWPGDHGVVADSTEAGFGPDATVVDPGWLVTLTGPGENSFSHVVVDARGNAFIAAPFEGTATLGAAHPLTAMGDSDFVVAKVGPDGTVQWVVTGAHGVVDGLTSDGEGGAYLVVGAAGFSKEVVLGDRHLAGLPYTGILVARVSARGTVMWATASSGDDNATSSRVDVTGLPTGPVVVGALEGSLELGGAALAPPSQTAGYVIWLAAATGTAESSMAIGGSKETSLTTAVTDSAGDLRLGGHFKYKSAIGALEIPGQGIGNVFAARLSASGIPAWATVAGGPGAYVLHDIDVGPSGQTYLVGDRSGDLVSTLTLGSHSLPLGMEQGCFVGRVEHDGAASWLVGSQGAKKCLLSSVAAASGVVYVAGGYSSGALAFGGCALPTLGEEDVRGFVLRLTDAGICEKAVGLAGDQHAFANVAAHQGKVWLAGGFDGTATFGPNGTRTATNKTDGFLWRLPHPPP